MKVVAHRATCIGFLLMMACEGQIIVPPGAAARATPTSLNCVGRAPSVAAAPMRRLTRFEYNRTVHALFGDSTQPALAFPDEELVLGFDNNSSQQSLSGLLIEGYEQAASSIAQRLVADVPGLLECTPTVDTQDQCVHDFLPRFGLKLWRRPLEADEVDRLETFYLASKTSYDFTTAVRMVVEAMLQSPHFLYRIEPLNEGSQPARVTAYALATRLSYLLWSSAPDATLLEAAGQGRLDERVGLEAQVQRMLGDPRAHDAVGRFFEQWLELDKLARVQKSTTLFPQFNRELATLMRQETAVFVDDLVFNSGTLEGLFNAPYSFMNAPLAAFYGLTGPTTSKFEKVTLDSTKRSGLLTHAGLLAAAANIDQTSPVQRGLFVRSQFLCQTPPPPPANAKKEVGAPSASQTTRQRFAQHESNPSCSGCHMLMDPIGLGFEHYDAIGRWRDTEGTLPIDASGELKATQDIEGRFDGAIELSQRLSKSAQVRECVATQWFRYAYGRVETEADACSIDALTSTFTSSGGDFRSLLLALTSSQAFLYRGASQ